jgi:hypothetical protein
MKVLEIEQALMIRLGDTSLVHERTIHKDMVQLCGPFVENRDGIITFVHLSAKE